MEGDISCTSISSLSGSFQSTPSAWRETSSCLVSICKSPNFNPLPPHGGRLCPACDDLYNIFIFQSTPSAWRETRLCLLSITGELFQSTPSAWRETHYGERGESLRIISIHSLRMEGDSSPLQKIFALAVFQSTPSAWRETCNKEFSVDDFSFQSTPSAWRETLGFAGSFVTTDHFNPLPPHGGRLQILACNREI